MPLRIKTIGGLLGQPGRKGFVEPDLLPRSCGHEVAKPLVCDLMRDNAENAALSLRAAFERIEQQGSLVVRNQAPVFHRTVSRTGHRNLVKLRKNIINAKIFVIKGKNFLGCRHRIGTEVTFAWCGQDAQLDSP